MAARTEAESLVSGRASSKKPLRRLHNHKQTGMGRFCCALVGG